MLCILLWESVSLSLCQNERKKKNHPNVNIFHVYMLVVCSDFDVVSLAFYCSFSSSNMMILLELKIQFTFTVAKRKFSPIHCGKWLMWVSAL